LRERGRHARHRNGHAAVVLHFSLGTGITHQQP
jgi:hypothetical protein